MKTRLLLMSLFLSITIAHSQVYVDASATGNNDGTSWADAYDDLQSALGNNPAGTFWVKAGTYIPGTNRTDVFSLTNNQEIYGGFDGTEVSLSQRDASVNLTILSGDINGNDNTLFSATDANRAENSYRIIDVNGDNVIIDGFSIINGNANGSATSDQEGAAVNFNISSDSEINNCKFMRHTLTRGGIIRSVDVAPQMNLEITNSIFKENEASFATVYYGRANGNLDIKFEGCLFTNNISLSATGSIIWLRQDVSGSQSVEIINSTFSDNELDSSRAIIDKLNVNGGVVMAQVYNSIFWNNGDGTGSFSDAVESGTSGDVENSISNNNFANHSSTTNVSNTNPLFTDSVNGDYTLQSSSPAIDSGENTRVSTSTISDLAGNQRIFNATVDMGPYEFGANPASTTVIYVDAAATGNNDGTSWADAYDNLQIALNNNPAGTIWVKAGTYIPGTNRTDVFSLTNNQKIYGGFDGTEVSLSQRDAAVNLTILSGDINGNDNTLFSATDPNRAENSYRIIDVNGDNVIIDGFSIINGNANGSATSDQEGAAVNFNISSDSEINNCKFMRHTLIRGGIIRSIDVAPQVNIEITNSIFKENEASFATVYYGRANGNLDIKFEGCLFTNNISLSATGSIIWLRQDVSGSQSVEIINSTFSDNELDSSRAIIDKLNVNGGVVMAQVYNSIFWNNGDGTGSFSDAVESGTSGDVENSISNNNFANHSSTTNVSNTNPLFTDSVNGDYTLQSSSPAIDGGDNQYVTLNEDLLGNARIYGSAVDMGAYEFGSSLSIADAEGNITEVKLYPNPASNIINIISNQVNIKSVGIYDVLGKQVLATTNKKDINVSDLKSGMYIVKIEFENNTRASKRFIKL
ncbi:T9SS type A sorting domain-containing protein [Winogradskyella eckloniae]|uniref:T9SS type A sorting domain-containing protein n=1 Tax=Winogradskyella eckloniae TaxID=1089306 RepID=UPI0015672732|nr:T9SS type A sorting domain-containing protein [Winogradskyella eckloniae]NRD20880.1 T9SS type A sorting domain-containing protein [Winogradskyella eckloniae]